MSKMPKKPSGYEITSRLAIASLVVALLAWVTIPLGESADVFHMLMFTGHIVAGLVAAASIVVGLVALYTIRSSQGVLKGRGIAVAGMVIACIHITMLCLSVPAIQSARQHVRHSYCMRMMTRIEEAKEQARRRYGYVDRDVIPEEQIDDLLNLSGWYYRECPSGEVDGAKYLINPVGQSPECPVHGKLY